MVRRPGCGGARPEVCGLIAMDQRTAMRLLYSPAASEIAQQLPVVGAGIADAFRALAGDPSPARAAMVRAQLDGASLLLAKYREALLREAEA